MVQKHLNKYFKNTRWQLNSLLNSFWINKFINILIFSGKKIKSQKLIFKLFFLLKQSFFFNPIFSFFNALEILRPTLELSFKKVGKKMYQIPTPLNFFRQYLIIFRWFKKCFQKSKNSKKFFLKLLVEFTAVLTKKGKSELWKNKINLYNTAILNRSYSHYRWK